VHNDVMQTLIDLQRAHTVFRWFRLGIGQTKGLGVGPSQWGWKKFHNRFSWVTGTNIYMKSYV